VDRRASITFGVTGQSVELYPPEWVAGAPSSVTFAVYTATQSNDDDPEFSDSGDVDPVSTTLDGSAGAAQHAAAGGRRRVPLTATTSIVQGRDYLVTNAANQRERVRVTAISSGAYVEVEHDLAYDYASGATFVGLLMSADIDDTFAATESALNTPDQPYRVLWTYTAGGVERRLWTYFDLVRQAKKHGVTVDALLGEWPTLLYQLGKDERGRAADRAISAAWDQVQLDLESAGLDPNSLRDGGKLDMLVKKSALMVFGNRGEGPPGRDTEQWQRERFADYKSTLEKLVSGNKLIRSEGTEGGISTDPVRPGWFSS